MRNILRNRKIKFNGYVFNASVLEDIFLNDEDKKVYDDPTVLHDTNIIEDEDVDVNIFQPLMQDATQRQVKDLSATIKSECEEKGQLLV